MKKLNCLLIFLLFTGLSTQTFSQSKKDIKKHKIKSVKVTMTTVKNGVEVTIPESFERYDSDSKLLEIIDYDKEGKVKMHESYVLNKNGDVTEQINYSPEGKVEKKIITKYDALGDKTEESRFDGDGKLINKEIYTYNAQGERTTEITMDSKNNVIKKEFNLYDKKGMKIERRTTDGKGTVLEIRKYTYEY
ncbi:MAG TPA: hypothetical protein PKJ62_02950 [Bacteroidia bacterium]|nr:hypothetical protein [Bacteroidia bacterium]